MVTLLSLCLRSWRYFPANPSITRARTYWTRWVVGGCVWQRNSWENSRPFINTVLIVGSRAIKLVSSRDDDEKGADLYANAYFICLRIFWFKKYIHLICIFYYKCVFSTISWLKIYVSNKKMIREYQADELVVLIYRYYRYAIWNITIIFDISLKIGKKWTKKSRKKKREIQKTKTKISSNFWKNWTKIFSFFLKFCQIKKLHQIVFIILSN